MICLGKQLLYNYPQIYDYSLPDRFAAENPNMASVVEGGHIDRSPWKQFANLSSLAGEQFISFAKSQDFGKG